MTSCARDSSGFAYSLEDDWVGRRVTVMGLGRHGGGVAVARYLARLGARVTISDAAARETLTDALADLDGEAIERVHVGGHRDEDFAEAEFVVVNPAVRPEHPGLQAAVRSGAVLTSEIEIFLRRCPARVIGITGSNGKSTVATMLAEVLRRAGLTTWLGGNIGHSLLGDVEGMSADDWVVLELSSFQLAHLSAGAPLPRVALVTNCTANHLDWHGSFAAYAAAKQRLLSAGDGRLAIVPGDDASLAGWRAAARCELREPWPLERVPGLAVPGEHNRRNAALVAAAAEVTGVDERTIVEALTDFRGLRHRVEFVAEIAGRRFYDDSKATSPAATLAALSAVEQPVWLLAGGQAKGVDFDDFAGALPERVRGAALFGEAREQLSAAIRGRRSDCRVHACGDLTAALDYCWRGSRAGDAILLSPACASLDQFRDYHDRGESFCRLVRALEACESARLR